MAYVRRRSWDHHSGIDWASLALHLAHLFRVYYPRYIPPFSLFLQLLLNGKILLRWLIWIHL